MGVGCQSLLAEPLCLLKLPSLPMLAALPWPTDGAARCSAASDPAVCPTSITQWGKIREYGFMCPCPPTEDFFGMCIWSGSLCFPFLIIIVVFKHGIHTLLALGSFRGKTKVRLLNIQKNWLVHFQNHGHSRHCQGILGHLVIK